MQYKGGRVSWIIVLVLWMLSVNSTAVYANDDPHFNAAFDKGMSTATSLHDQAFTKMQNFKPAEVIKDYSANPKEMSYQTNPNAMISDAELKRNTDKTATVIDKSILTHSKFTIDTTSPQMTQIQNKANGVYDLMMGQFGDCIKQTSCTTTYTTKECEETPKSSLQYCSKTLAIDLIPRASYVDYPFSVSISNRWKDYAAVLFNLTTGNVDLPRPGGTVASLSGRLPTDLHGGTASMSSYDKYPYISHFELSGHILNVNLERYPKNTTIHFVVRVTTQTVELSDNWNDGCVGLSNIASCKLTNEHCVSPNATHDIQGISVSRDCWEKESTYQCGGNESVLSCQGYRDQGCAQTASLCQKKETSSGQEESTCSLYTQTFQCPVKQCTDTGVICHGTTYCLTGDCVKGESKADPDFQKAISGLSAVSEAAKSYTSHSGGQFPIFAGVVKSCNKDFLNFADCCSDNGWGFDIHLAQCDPESKELGQAKAHGLSVYVDREDNCPLGGFCSHRKKYCVFPSKLARIIQEQGRRDQLQVSLGDYNHPDCRGLSPDEFSKLDLNRIDFSDFYADITQKVHLESQENINQRLNTKMQQWVDGKTPHG